MHYRIREFLDIARVDTGAVDPGSSLGVWFRLEGVRVFVRYIDLLGPDDDGWRAFLARVRGGKDD